MSARSGSAWSTADAVVPVHPSRRRRRPRAAGPCRRGARPGRRAARRARRRCRRRRRDRARPSVAGAPRGAPAAAPPARPTPGSRRCWSVPRRTLLRVVVGAAFLIGVAANYLGPSEHIHLVYNPLVALILWNLGVYVVVAVLTLRSHRPRRNRPAPTTRRRSVGPDAAGRRGAGATHVVAAPRVAGAGAGGRPRALRARAGHRTHERRARTARHRRRAATARPLAPAPPGNLASFRLERALHLGAIALCLGALAGNVRARRLPRVRRRLAQHVRARPGTVRASWRTPLLGPASLVLRGRGFDTAEIEALLAPAGLPAAPYIHLLAVAAAMYILVPRTLLATLDTIRLRRRGRAAGHRPRRALLRAPGRARARATAGDASASRWRSRCASRGRSSPRRSPSSSATSCTTPVSFPCCAPSASAAGASPIWRRSCATTCQAFEPALERFVTEAHAVYVRALAARAARLIGAEPVGHDAVAPPPALGHAARRRLGRSRRRAERRAHGGHHRDGVDRRRARGGHRQRRHRSHARPRDRLDAAPHDGPDRLRHRRARGLRGHRRPASISAVPRSASGRRRSRCRRPRLRVLLRDRKLEALVAQGRERAYAAVKAEVSADLEQSAPALHERLLAGLGPVLRRLAAERAP